MNISFGLDFRPKGGLSPGETRWSGFNPDVVNKHPPLAMLKTPSPQSACKAESNLAVLFTAPLLEGFYCAVVLSGLLLTAVAALTEHDPGCMTLTSSRAEFGLNDAKQ